MRKPLVAANWKMYKTPAEALAYFTSFYPLVKSNDTTEIVLCPSATSLPAMTDGRGFRAAVERFWMPALESFRPELVFVSAGFDAHRDDPLAYLKLDDEDYRWVSERLVDVAEQHAGGRVVSTLEGGYNTEALGRCVVEHLRVLMG